MKLQKYLLRNTCNGNLLNFFLLLLLYVPSVLTCPRNNNNNNNRPREYEGRIFIASPKKLSLDRNERISVIAYNVPDNEVMDVTIKDFPGMTKIFSSKRVSLKNGVPVFMDFNLPSNEILKYMETNIFGILYLNVYVEAKIGNKFESIMKVPVAYSKGYVFLQTDKPIYNPQQTVQIRIIALNEKLLPENNEVRVQIKNPQNIIVQETLFREPWKQSSGQFPKMNFTFPPFSMLGQWRIEASYGIRFQRQTSVSFHVEEYTLPTFAVKLRVPSAILSKDEKIDITVQAEYVYGKKVNGNALCKLIIVTQFYKKHQAGIKTVTVKDGKAKITLPAAELLKEAKLEDFPEKGELSINVSVTDEATGITENAKEERIKFALSPYRVSLFHMQDYYKPGVVYVIVADILYLNGKPAANIPASVKVTDSENRDVNVPEPKHKTNENGRVIFYVTPPSDVNYLKVTVTTNDNRYKSGQQASRTRQTNKFASNNFIAISRTESMRKLKIGENFVATVFTHPPDRFENLFYVVMARGRIQLMRHLHTGKSHQKQLEFIITNEMSPVTRVLVFTLMNKELLVDSMRIDVEAKCEPKSEVVINPDFPTVEPGRDGKFILKGEPNTKVGLLAVDKAVYSLKNEHRLTKEKLFTRITTSDYGSGLGDGMNSLKILSDSGLLLFGNFKVENTRDEHIVTNHLKIINFKEKDEDEVDPYFDGFLFDYDDIDENMEDEISIRSDFRETWLFEDYEIGHNGISVVNTKLPDSITTWVIQAVSVSPQWGMCVTDVKEMKSFKNFFLQLNIPYSLVRNEQLDLQATVFNYFPQKMPVTVHMYGVKNLRSGVKEGEKSERKRITIEPHSTGTVHFSIVPLVAQDYFIRVVALSPYGGDIVVRKLHVVAEGVTEEMDFVTSLDPTNQQKRKRRNIVSDVLSDIIDTSKQLQEIKFSLNPGKTYIPGTEMAVISLIGTEYGPTAQTVVLDPRDLIRMPTGCCEQTMTYLGPTLYTLNFLKSRGKIDLETEERLYDFVGKGYRRALTFRKDDGSFSIWPRRPSSIWLTSFVMKLFCQASKLIYVDENVICKGMQWIISNQNSDGSFEDPYPVIRRDIMHGSDGKVPMTAFVLTVLQQCKCSSVNINNARLKAKSFLEKQFESINDSYVMALTAYALAATNSQNKHQANEKLLKMSTFDEELNQRYWAKSSKTESIEITSYSLLTQLELTNMSTSLSIVNWLNTQRLDGGYFPSSQSTVIALQALSQYLITSKRRDISLTCNISTSHNKELVKTTQINNDNAFVLQQLEVNKLGGILYFNVSGKGVGLLSVKMRYNVADKEKQTCKFQTTVHVSEVNKQFSIQENNIHYEKENKIEVSEGPKCFSSNFHSKLTLKVKICSKYLSSKDSTMTIIDAGILSGFTPVKEDLDKIVDDYKNPVDRYEIEDRNIIFYLDHVTHKSPVCIDFRVKRDYIVGNVQSSVVKIYDYYNNDEQCIVFYSLDTKA
ncbi:complement C3-like isoform X2 [Centruroides sculpturatus]|uniref:complement C3-like isoform X2 n=1 Tax=Centruroides sculpturatus TaxID=218467 RepID=UPI000C6EB25C|nr:complement C3-like isoform X2 [Centruroides sculpturatus]